MNHVQSPESPRTNGFPALGTRLREPLFMILAAVVCGLAGGFGAVGFRQLIKVFQAIFFGEGKDLVTLAVGLPTILSVREIPSWWPDKRKRCTH